MTAVVEGTEGDGTSMAEGKGGEAGVGPSDDAANGGDGGERKKKKGGKKSKKARG